MHFVHPAGNEQSNFTPLHLHWKSATIHSTDTQMFSNVKWLLTWTSLEAEADDVVSADISPVSVSVKASYTTYTQIKGSAH